MKMRPKWVEDKEIQKEEPVTEFLPHVDPRPEPKLWWECVFCMELARILHRGTAYCRKCYDIKNQYGKLVDN